jgi:hypothetical protein
LSMTDDRAAHMPEVPTYVTKALALLAPRLPLAPGTVVGVFAAHDADCPMVTNGAAHCACDPDVSVVEVPAQAVRAAWN